MLPILVGSCFVLYAGIAAAFFFESWFQIHLFALWMLMPIISLFSGNTPSFAILYFLSKKGCKCGVAVVVYRRKGSKNICQKLYQNFSLLPWINETIVWNFNWIEENLYSQHREQCIARCYLDLWGYFLGTLPLGHVCIILDDNLQTNDLDMFQLSNSEWWVLLANVVFFRWCHV